MNKYLLIAALITAIAALLHIGIIVMGPSWYRFFGAGEGMAQMAEKGSAYPVVITLMIFAVLATFSIYAFSGAGYLPPLPLQRVVLYGAGGVFLLRGILGIPAVLMIDHPYLLELRARPIFMVVTSVIVIFMGLMYVIGTLKLADTPE